MSAHALAIPPSIVPPGSTTTGTTGIPAFGTQIQVLSQASPEAFTTIAGVGDITGPNTQVAEVETTSHSTGIPHRTFIPTLIDDGDLSFPCYFNPSDPTHSINSPFGLENLFQNRAVTDFQLVNTDPSHRTRKFRGFVKQLSETYPVQGVCTRQTTIRITSVPTDVVATVTLLPTNNLTETAAGGSQTIAVTSADVQPWFPVSSAPWVTIDSPVAPVTGNGSVGYTVAANTTGQPARSATITVGDKLFEITQAAG